ncbi:MAG: peptide chain release factor N(5)-glutamine methyltransferase [Firmicutes bacterium]|nr:peptide chain release factor N(5)-glutamine methyltransferase [Bacillota bacterium]
MNSETKKMTLVQLFNSSIAMLTPHFGASEARWLVRTAMEHLNGYSLTDIALRGDSEATGWLRGKMREVIHRLLTDEPIQYIFSEASFYGLKLKVTPATLIPRPETAELVDMVVKEHDGQPDLRVLDACTGSGCIAIALARNLPFARVDAFDVSAEALEVARENNHTLKTNVDFFQADALALPEPEERSYDIIVSNPPYIAEHEQAAMEPNVLNHEPHIALFVPDNDPLKFYKAIAGYAQKALKNGGMIYFELNPLYADELARWMKGCGWQDVQIFTDSQKHKRFMSATLSE